MYIVLVVCFITFWVFVACVGYGILYMIQEEGVTWNEIYEFRDNLTGLFGMQPYDNRKPNSMPNEEIAIEAIRALEVAKAIAFEKEEDRLKAIYLVQDKLDSLGVSED